jgi:DNA adenine methylase
VSKAFFPRPVVSWLGGKTRLLRRLLPLLEPPEGRYLEPFCGGAAAYLALSGRLARPALVSDANPTLVECYRALAADPDRVARGAEELLSRHRDAPTQDARRRHYELQRAALNRWSADLRAPRPRVASPGSPWRARLAALVLYLSKACYGGVWRENRSGGFNVPPRADRVARLDEGNLRAAAAALARAEVARLDFRDALSRAGAGDLALLDPPYPPGRPGGFSQYLADGFGPQDHEDLRDAAAAAARRGCRVVVTIADCAVSRALWEPAALSLGGRVSELEAPRSIGARHRAARTAGEIVVELPGAGS